MKLALILVAVLGAQPDDARLAVPDPTAQAGAERLIDAVYGEKLKDAKTADAKRALAREILEVVKQEPDAANKYVGLQTAKRLAVEAEDAALGLDVVQVLVAQFTSKMDGDAEGLIRQADLLWEAAEKKRGTGQLAGQLDAVELWLRSGNSSPLAAKKWEERINSLRSGGEIVLHAKDAKIVGGKMFFSQRIQSACNWRDPREYLEWQVSLDRGPYELSLRYAAAGAGGGYVFGVSLFPKNANRPLSVTTFVVPPTGSWEEFVNRPAGKLVVKADGDYILRLHAVAKAQEDPFPGLINLQLLRLDKR